MNLKDLKNVKLFIGPMSKNIVDTIIDFSMMENYKIGIIPSRRQVDWDGGYVNNWTTEIFIDYIKYRNNLIIERDHAGIGQGEHYDNGIISLYTDAKSFDIIHIDPWKFYKNDFQKGIQETIDNIKFINKINQNCLFEVGTEESICHFNEYDIYNMLSILKDELDHHLFEKIVYCVIQSGTGLKGTKNIGHFDSDRLKNMVEICNRFDVLSKEHNGDYLDIKEIKYRFDIGLSAINIAPEFGVFETDVILEHLNDNQKETFFNICYKSDKWKKWVDDDFDPFKNKNELMRICGHYQFSTKEFKEMNLDSDNIIKERLYNKIKKMFKYE